MQIQNMEYAQLSLHILLIIRHRIFRRSHLTEIPHAALEELQILFSVDI